MKMKVQNIEVKPGEAEEREPGNEVDL